MLDNLAGPIVLAWMAAGLAYCLAGQLAEKRLSLIPGDRIAQQTNSASLVLRWVGFVLAVYGLVMVIIAAILQYTPEHLPMTYGLHLVIFAVVPLLPALSLVKLRQHLHQKYVRHEVYSITLGVTICSVPLMLAIQAVFGDYPETVLF